jgi:hypothetical protein
VIALALLWSSMAQLANSRARDSHGDEESAVARALPAWIFIWLFGALIVAGVIFLVCWKIYGSVITYGIDRSAAAIARPTACPAPVYDLAYWLIAIEWIVVGCGIVAQVLVCVYGCGHYQPTPPPADAPVDGANGAGDGHGGGKANGDAENGRKKH